MSSRAQIGVIAAIAMLSLSGNGPDSRAATQTDWLARAQHQIAAREYEASRTVRGLQAPNRAHSMRTYFTPAGIRVHEREAENTELLSLSLASVGRVDELVAVPVGEVSNAGSRVEIRRPGLVEWYENSPEGLEQGFTLFERPDGAGELVLELALSGARASLRGDSVLLTAASGRRLSYGHLVVVDAQGRDLASRFELAATGQVRLAIDDAAAAYPVVIDPMLAETADAELQGDQFQASLGSSVAGAGDVNGDGYDDVIVGARDYDAGQTDEGAAFVFLGGPAGIDDAGPGTAAARLESDQANAELGASVASAGDVNADGYDDVVVGAEFYDTSVADSGAAFVFLGGTEGIANGNPSTAAAQLDSVGTSVAGAGDVNGDGYDDVIAAGAVAALFHGGPAGIADGPPDSAATRLSGVGYVVAGAGDVNGDGYDDVIVGNPYYGPWPYMTGIAYVFLGSSNGIADGDASAASTRIESDDPRAKLGWSVAGAGDVNGDGYADVIVGAPGYGTIEWEQRPGAAFVFHGTATGISGDAPATAATRLLGEAGSIRELGTSVAGAGDVNADGRDDLIVGGPHAGDAAFVFLGAAGGIPDGGPHAAAVAFENPYPYPGYGGMGSSVAGAGDVNGDGYADVIAGHPFHVVDVGAGAAYVMHGNPNAGAARLASGQINSLFGVDVAGAGDLNGDGYGDIAVSAPWFDAGQPNEGAAFVFAGSAAGIARGEPATAATQLESDQANARFGYPVAAAGDVNGDGYDDLLVGASRYAMAGPSAAAVFVFLGSATGIADGGPASAASALELDWMPFATTTWVHSLASADVNGDRHRDVIAGSIHWDENYSERNVVAIFHGAESGIASGNSASADTVLEDEYFTPLSAAGAGDVNGDGFGDLIVGGENQYLGRYGASIFHGSAVGIPSGGFQNATTELFDQEFDRTFGSSVSAAGDVNGDGYSDVIVGADAYWDDFLEEPASAAFIFHGSPSGIGSGGVDTATTHLRADEFNMDLGSSVDAAGDINGDGYGDVIVSAPGAHARAGAAYAFLGSPAGIASGGPESAAIRIGPGDPNGFLGYSVAGAGDVNGDGAADLIVGANNGLPDDEGHAFVVLPEPTRGGSLASAVALLAALSRLTPRRTPGIARCR